MNKILKFIIEFMKSEVFKELLVTYIFQIYRSLKIFLMISACRIQIQDIEYEFPDNVFQKTLQKLHLV